MVSKEMKRMMKEGCECFEDDPDDTSICLAHYLRADDTQFRPEMGYPRVPGMG